MVLKSAKFSLTSLRAWVTTLTWELRAARFEVSTSLPPRPLTHPRLFARVENLNRMWWVIPAECKCYIFKCTCFASERLWRKGLQDLGFKDWSICRKSRSLILPFKKEQGGAFEVNFCPRGWKFEQANLKQFNTQAVAQGGGGMLKLRTDRRIASNSIIRFYNKIGKDTNDHM